MPDLTDAELAELLDNAPIVFGLRAQGKLPTIEKMLSDGASWDEIGKAIGWCPKTAQEHWQRAAVAELAALRAQRDAERAARASLIVGWRCMSKWEYQECADQLAALDAPAVSTGPRIIGFGETSRHIEILWDGERIEFQRGADGRWRNVGQPRQSAPNEEPSE